MFSQWVGGMLVATDHKYDCTPFEIWSSDMWSKDPQRVIGLLEEFGLVEDKFEAWYSRMKDSYVIGSDGKEILRQAFEAGKNVLKDTE